MGCFIISCRPDKPSFTSMTKNYPSFSFSYPNELNFLVPKNFCFEISQLKDIIISDQSIWKNYQNLLYHMKCHFLDEIQAISWFFVSQRLEDSVKIEHDSINSCVLGNSSHNLLSSKSFVIYFEQKNNFFENFPFMKNYNPKNYKTKLTIEIESIICSRKFLALHPYFKKPFIEIEIHSFADDDIESKTSENLEEIIKYTANCSQKLQGRSFEWKEVFSYDMQNMTKSDNGFFSISLFFVNESSKKKELIGEKYVFSFSELGNQMVTEKNINIREGDKNEIYCSLLFKCQLVFDVLNLLLFWKNDLEVKDEVIKRILRKSENKKIFSLPMDTTKSKSLSNDKKNKDAFHMMMESYKLAFKKTSKKNQSLKNDRVSVMSVIEAYKKNCGKKMNESLISEDSDQFNQSIYYDNKYYLS